MSILDLFQKNNVYTNKPIRLWKDKKSGKLRWLAAYSSNYLDDDYPRDIISKDAHVNFISKVQNKEIPYPELWLWHLKGTAIGEADYMFYDEDNGIAMATGFIYNGMDSIAKNIAKLPVEMGVSHGMINVMRNKDDKKVIDDYVTIEISILPLAAAANKMTSIYMLGEEKNMMSTEQKEFLKDTGMTDEDIAVVEAHNKQLADENSSRERKSADETEAPEQNELKETQSQETPEAEKDVAKQTEKLDEETEPESHETKAADDDSAVVTVGQLKDTIKYMTDALSEKISEMEANMNKAISALHEQSAQLAKSINDQTLTPGTTLRDVIIGKGIIDKSVSRNALGASQLTEDDPLNKETPTITDAPSPSPEKPASIGELIFSTIVGEKK